MNASKADPTPRPWWTTRAGPCAAGALAFAIALTAISGAAAPSVWAVLLYDGATAALIVAGATLCGRWIMRPLWRRGAPGLAFRLATDAAAGLGFFALALLGIGLAGWLTPWIAYALLLAGAAPGLIGLRIDLLTHWLGAPARWGWLVLPLTVPAAVAAAGATLPPGVLWGDEPHGYDVLEYHLQVPRQWFDAGRITLLDDNVFSAMPFNVEMLYLLAMLLRGGPWAGMYAAQFLHVALVLLSVVAVSGIARDDEAVGPMAALAAGAAPWLALLAPMAYNEGGLLLFGTIAIVIALRAGTRNPVAAFYAGAFAGLAGGAKLTGVAMVVIALPPAVTIAALAIRRERPSIRGAGAFALGAALLLSPWLARTAAWTGNPVWPEAMSLLGRGHFSQAQAQRWNAAHAPRPDQRSLGARLEAGVDQIALNWRYGYLLLPAALIVGLRRSADARGATLLVLLLLLAIIWLAFTHLQGRFFVLGVPIAAMLLALAPGRAWRSAVACMLCATALVGWVGTGTTAEPSGLLPRIERYFSGPFAAAVGLTDYTLMLPPEVASAVQGSAPIILVGDAAAFGYPVPSSRLYYRTVFDVPAEASDAVAAWLSGISQPLQHASWRIISPGELRRFARTYLHIPPPPPLPDQQLVIPPGRPLP